jgi:hypothetical protein
MSQNPITAIAVIGVDIGKDSFHVVGLDQRGAIVLRQKWSRGQVEARFANMPPCLGVSLFYFFEGAPIAGKKMPAPQEGELPEGAIVSFLGTREGAALVRGFLAVKQKPIRQNLIDFIATLKTK